MSGLGKPPAGYGILGFRARRVGSAASSEWENLSDMNYNSVGLSLMQTNLTNEIDPRHLQNCISALGYLPRFLGFLASLRQQIGKKGDAGFEKIIA
jgi:hypothetical protein